MVAAAGWVVFSTFFLPQVEARLRGAFPGSAVSIQGYRIEAFRRVSLEGIKVQRNEAYDFEVAEAFTEFDVTTLLSGQVGKVGLRGARLEVALAERSIAALKEYFPPRAEGKGGVVIHELLLEDISLDVQAKDLKASAVFSADYFPAHAWFQKLELTVPELESRGVKVQNLSAESGERGDRMNVAVERITVGKATAEAIDGIVRVEWPNLFADFLVNRTFGGQVKGSVSAAFNGETEYLAELRFTDIKIERFVEDFELKDRFLMDGLLSGDLVLQGKGAEVRVLSGDFRTALGGGNLTIQDTRFLEDIAQRTGQPPELIVDNFKNYHYNTGVFGVSLTDGKIISNVAFDGETGKRDLTITLHDFLPGTAGTE